MLATDIQDFLNTAVQLADAAREMAMTHFRQPLLIEHKADTSPVTLADQAIERHWRALLASRYPQHGILGEEFANHGLDKDLVWVLDPIDGTKSFASGKPLFGSLIALFAQGVAQLGVIEAPALGERWLGVRAQPTQYWRDGQVETCQTSNCNALKSARLYATSPSMFVGKDARRFAALQHLVDFCCYGGDCYSYGLLACGHVDLVVEAQLKPFDFAALVNVIEGAGGVISDWQGQALNLQSDGRVVAAATPELHQQALAILTT